jgi:acyl-CoA-binding protein
MNVSSLHSRTQDYTNVYCYFFFEPIPMNLIKEHFSETSPLLRHGELWENIIDIDELPPSLPFEILETDHLFKQVLSGIGNDDLKGYTELFKGMTHKAYEDLINRADFEDFNKEYYAPYVPHLKLRTDDFEIPIHSKIEILSFL